MIIRSVRTVAVVLLTLGLVPDSRAQTHFNNCVDGELNIFNATIVVPASSRPTLNGMEMPVGSEIAVYATGSGSEDLCVGVMKVDESSGFITVWGDDLITPLRDGLANGESFAFRIWDSGLDFEFPSDVISSSLPIHSRFYTNDRTFIVDDLSVFWTFTGVTIRKDVASVEEDSTLTLDVLANDISFDGVPLRVYQTTPPAHGSVEILESGELRYTPDQNYFGPDSLVYYAVGDAGNIGQGKIEIDVSSVNDLPVIVSTPPGRAQVDRVYYFAVIGYDIESPNLEVIGVDLPDWLAVEPTGTRSANLVGTPGVDDIGTPTIRLGVSDGLDTTFVSFKLKVEGVDGQTSNNHAPVAVNDAYTVPEDSVLVFSVLDNDDDPDGDRLSVQSFDPPATGTVELLPEGQMAFTPPDNFFGEVTFSYTASDSLGLTVDGQVVITVSPVNDPAVIATQPPTSAETGSPYVYEILAGDVDGDDLAFSAPSLPPWLVLTDNGDGSAILTGTPAVGDVGKSVVTIEVSDGVESVSQLFEVNVVAAAGFLPPEPPTVAFEEIREDVALDPVLEWSQVPDADRYHVQLAKGRAPDFLTTVFDDSTLTDTFVSISELDPDTWYAWRVRAGNQGGFGAWSENVAFATRSNPDTGNPGEEGDAPSENETVPDAVQLLQNYPNPFNPETTIAFDLPSRSHAVIEIFDLLGHHVATLVDRFFEAGRHEVHWYAAGLPSGIYVYRLRSGNSIQTRTLSLVK